MTPEQLKLCQEFLARYPNSDANIVSKEQLITILPKKIEEISKLENPATYARQNSKNATQIYSLLRSLIEHYTVIHDALAEEYRDQLHAFITKSLLINTYMFIYENTPDDSNFGSTLDAAETAYAEFVKITTTNNPQEPNGVSNTSPQNDHQSPYAEFIIKKVKNRGNNTLRLGIIEPLYIQAMQHLLTQCKTKLIELFGRDVFHQGSDNITYTEGQMRAAVSATTKYLSENGNEFDKKLAIDAILGVTASLIKILNLLKKGSRGVAFNIMLCDFVIAIVELTIPLEIKAKSLSEDSEEKTIAFIKNAFQNFQPTVALPTPQNNAHTTITSSTSSSNSSLASSFTENSNGSVIDNGRDDDNPPWMRDFARDSLEYKKAGSVRPSMALRKIVIKPRVQELFPPDKDSPASVGKTTHRPTPVRPAPPPRTVNPVVAEAWTISDFFPPAPVVVAPVTHQLPKNFFENLLAEWNETGSGIADPLNEKTKKLQLVLRTAANAASDRNQDTDEVKIQKVLVAAMAWSVEERKSPIRTFFLGESRRIDLVTDFIKRLNEELCLIRDPEGSAMKKQLEAMKTAANSLNKKERTEGIQCVVDALANFNINNADARTCHKKLMAMQHQVWKDNTTLGLFRSETAKAFLKTYAEHYFWMEKDKDVANSVKQHVI